MILLGDRYGWRPLPNEIPEEEFSVLKELSTVKENELLNQWYRLDSNSKSLKYLLLPREGIFRVDYTQWKNQVETPLVNFFERVIRKLHWPNEKKIKYLASATEQEIYRGAISGETDSHNALCFFRHLNNLCPNDYQMPFFDVMNIDGKNQLDINARIKLEALKENIKKELIDSVYEYSVDANELKDGKAALEIFKKEITQRLKNLISETINNYESKENENYKSQDDFLKNRIKYFVGR